MNCADFLKLWNDRLDNPASAAGWDVSAHEEHTRSCESCRRLSASLPILSIPSVPPAVPAGFTDRVLVAWESNPGRSLPWYALMPRRIALAAGLAAAACALLMIAGPRRKPETAAVPVATIPPTASLTMAFSDATSATFDLAREASAPAVRVGQGVLDASGLTETSWPVAVEVSSASAGVLQGVSRRLNAGVKPLSGSARRAFSFLAAPASPPARTNAVTPPDSGA